MDFIAALPIRLGLLLAVAVNPWLVVRHFRPSSRDGVLLAAATGATSVALCSAIPVILQLAGVAITPATLAAAQWSMAAVLFAAAALRRMPIGLTDGSMGSPLPLTLAFGFALLVLPFTHLAGIDTYKWQDLATSLRVEQRIAWLVHPLSLLGFTPRSYPSAQPLTLAALQMLGGLNVEWGFFAMSVVSGWTGIFAAYALGRRLGTRESEAAWFAFVYGFSPVFMRYNHWATGRGLCVALLPLFLLALLDLPRPRAWPALMGTALLLFLSHKAGGVAVGLILASCVFVPVLPRSDRRGVMAVLVIPFVLLAVLLSPSSGHGPAAAVIGFARQCVTRFGWYVPAAAAGLLLAGEWFSRPDRRRLLPAALLTFPLAFHSEMYGALIALPFVTLAAADGLRRTTLAGPRVRRVARPVAFALTAAAALAVVVHRSLYATTPAVWRAARFLEAYDPLGPFRIDARGSARSQIQGYVSGCPRFEVTMDDAPRVAFRRPPPLFGPPRRAFQEWTGYLRHWIEVPEADTDWYGRAPRVYYVTVNEEGPLSAQARLLYEGDGVAVYAPVNQRVP